MAAKKKGAGSTLSDISTSPEDAVVTQGNGNTTSTDVSIDHIAEGEFEVNLHDLGIPPEDMEAYRRIKALKLKRRRGSRPHSTQGPQPHRSSQGPRERSVCSPKPK